MRNLLKIVLMSCLLVTAVGCGQKDKRQSIRRGNSAPHYQPPSDLTTWGEITSDRQEEFQTAVSSFISATDDPENLGEVSGESQNSNTGIRFWGVVETDGSFSRGHSYYSSQQQIRPETSEFQIVIWDSFVGQNNGQGGEIFPYSIYIKGAASGHVTGNQATVTFSDDHGSITLEGSFSGDDFTGVVRFSNNKYWDGQTPGSAGTIGKFRVKICGFFACQQ